MKKVTLTVNSRGKANRTSKCKGCDCELRIVEGYNGIKFLIEKDADIANLDLFNDDDLAFLRKNNHVTRCEALEELISQ